LLHSHVYLHSRHFTFHHGHLNGPSGPRGVFSSFDTQSNLSPRTMNALLQLLQQSQTKSSPPPSAHIPSIGALEQRQQSIQAINPSSPSPQQAGITGPLQQQTPEALGASIIASQIFSDTLKMITPVGQSPNDEQLLVMALQSGLSQGLDHRRAIERLHGVSPRPHILRLPLNPANRSTIMPPIYGRIITSNTNLV